MTKFSFRSLLKKKSKIDLKTQVSLVFSELCQDDLQTPSPPKKPWDFLMFSVLIFVSPHSIQYEREMEARRDEVEFIKENPCFHNTFDGANFDPVPANVNLPTPFISFSTSLIQ